MAEGPYTATSLSPLRKIIAARMTEAKRLIPHFRVSMDIEMEALLALRARTNEESDRKVSINDCLVKCCASALMKHPSINIRFEDEKIHQYHQADISVAVAVKGGVATPVVRGAEAKSLNEIAVEVEKLAMRAAGGQLRMHEVLGGTFSISNLGAYGVDEFDAIINPPQGAILAVGTVKPRVVVTEGKGMRVARMLRATLSADHRCIDGTDAAAFLSTLRQYVEQPQALLVSNG